jgi:hypothetical protein
MAFTKLQGRLNSLPLILAGPLVRRVEPGSVTIWVALRRKRRIRLEIYDADPPSGQIVATGQRDTIAIGTNLHIACVTAKPVTPFAAGTTFQYNLFFDHLGGNDDIPSGGDLFAPRIFSASTVALVAQAETRNALAYASDGGPSRPSFALPPSHLDDLRLLHGSCRKISGPHADALEAADHMLRDAFRTGAKRPHMLFLTGDNIYNDGCAPQSFEVILDAASVLLAWDESIVMGDPGFTVVFKDLSQHRWVHSLNSAGLSSPGAELRQLFGLGEVIVLHLLTFGPVLWPDDLDYQRNTFDFRGTLPAVRRALANIPSYMIFDDHEFSNSWNLTAEWVESVIEKSFGRRSYQNALAAFALCQGWGNTPEQFETGAGKALLDAIVAWGEAEILGTQSPAAPLAEISRRTGLPAANDFGDSRNWADFKGPDVVNWHYSVPCPMLNIDVLDTFMWRSYEGSTTNAILVSEEGLDQQISAAQPTAECSLIVVSNVGIEIPGGGGQLNQVGWFFTRYFSILLLPFWLVAQVVTFIISLFSSKPSSLPSAFALLRALLYEPEYGASFEQQTKGFELLISNVVHRAPQQIVGTKRQARAVLLSGDAHRSFSMRMEYWSRVPFNVTGNPVEAVVAQFVGSPCKWVNPTKYKLKDPNLRHWAGWRNQPALTWVNEPDEQHFRFKASPFLLTYVPGANQPVMNPAPEWQYSIEPVAPGLPPDHEPLDIPDRPNPTLADQLAEMKLVANGLLAHTENAHVIKVNNLTEITFDWTPGSKRVSQHVWWRGQPSVDLQWTISHFDVGMEPPPSPPQLPQ